MPRSTLRRVAEGVVVAASLVLVLGRVRVAETAPTPTATTTTTTAAPAPAAKASPPARGPVSGRVTESLASFGCNVPDRGNSGQTVEKAALASEVVVPPQVVLPDGSYDLVLHFHGREPIRRIAGATSPTFVVAALDKGDSSGDYMSLFPTRQSFDELVASVDEAVTRSTGQPARAKSVLLSSFSAGYEATRHALLVSEGSELITGVLLLDSLYGGFRGVSKSVDTDKLAPFEVFARRSLIEPRVSFLLTHSDVPVDDYASTKVVADALVDRLVLRADRTRASGPRALERRAEEKGFVLRGYGGTERDDHCAHLALFSELATVWQARSNAGDDAP